MRVIAGTARGKKLKTPEDQNVRPTLDRVKEDIFNILGPAIRGAQVLDLFAGSGALGIEALSRGADSCIFVDKDKKSCNLTKYNLGETRLADKAQILQMEAEAAIKKLATEGKCFDYIFIDPPYHLGKTQSLLQNIQKCHIIQENTCIIVEADKKETMPEKIDGLIKIREKVYSSTRIALYAKETSQNE